MSCPNPARYPKDPRPARLAKTSALVPSPNPISGGSITSGTTIEHVSHLPPDLRRLRTLRTWHAMRVECTASSSDERPL